MNEDKAARYHRLKRWVAIASLTWIVALLAALIVTGASVSLRSTADAWAARTFPNAWHPSGVVFFYVIILSMINEAGSLPLAWYSGVVLEGRYELSTESRTSWLRDRLKAFLISLLLGTGGALLVYGCIRWLPDAWWLPAGGACALIVVGLAQIAPVVLLPLFYSVKPLQRDSLRSRLLALADRAGARVLGAYEWGLAEKTKKANAALAGIGGTRRILVSDTMLAEYTDDEIEVVLAHELAHHVHGDVWKQIAFECGLILAGFYLASRALGVLAGPVGLGGVEDVAGLPVLLLTAGALSVVMAPVANAMSRTFERKADRFALDLTRNPSAFISAMRRLGAQNLAEDRPSKIVQWLFYSHPPMRDRIGAAQAFKI